MSPNEVKVQSSMSEHAKEYAYFNVWSWNFKFLL